MTQVYLQEDQPSNVPPLRLTGERTLPDLPAENYWFRRHLAVYEWIAARIAGQCVVDMACGEGYGAHELAKRAAKVYGVDANPEAYEHARLRYRSSNLSFKRALVEEFKPADSVDAVVFLQTVEHLQEPQPVLEHFASLLTPGGLCFVSTPNRLTLAPPGAERSDNPWHVREYDAAEFRELIESVFADVKLFGLFHARRLRVHEIALGLGWDSVHKQLGLTERFYDRFTPAIRSSDFALREGNLDRALDFLAVARQ